MAFTFTQTNAADIDETALIKSITDSMESINDAMDFPNNINTPAKKIDALVHHCKSHYANPEMFDTWFIVATNPTLGVTYHLGGLFTEMAPDWVPSDSNPNPFQRAVITFVAYPNDPNGSKSYTYTKVNEIRSAFRAWLRSQRIYKFSVVYGLHSGNNKMKRYIDSLSTLPNGDASADTGQKEERDVTNFHGEAITKRTNKYSIGINNSDDNF